jgi:phosphoribosylamine--glycine ligase
LTTTNVLIIGGGGREHAIAWKLRQSPKLGDLCVAPGNAGIAQLAETLPLTIPNPFAPASEIAAFKDVVIAIARSRAIDLVVVAPDDPLALGLVDVLEAAGIAAFGPTAAAAEIEASKAFAKGLMRRHGIPCGANERFDSFDEAARYVESRPGNVVVKADGLSGGKGAIVTSSHEEAIAALRELLVDGRLGTAGAAVVIEDMLAGPETSAMAFSDGVTVSHMPFSCDHKAVFDGNKGPNTGGMGAYSPPPWLDAATQGAIRRDVTEAAAHAMASEGRPFRGVLYPGIMVTSEGPRVLEFNARFGDPETQCLLPLLESDLLDIMLAVRSRRLADIDVRWRDEASVTVCLASGGYPGRYETGKPIRGLDNLDDGVIVFHAGTRVDNRQLVTAGGRVIAITATAETLDDARAKVYGNIERISFEGMHHRRDIGAGQVMALT